MARAHCTFEVVWFSVTTLCFSRFWYYFAQMITIIRKCVTYRNSAAGVRSMLLWRLKVCCFTLSLHAIKQHHYTTTGIIPQDLGHGLVLFYWYLFQEFLLECNSQPSGSLYNWYLILYCFFFKYRINNELLQFCILANKTVFFQI